MHMTQVAKCCQHCLPPSVGTGQKVLNKVRTLLIMGGPTKVIAFFGALFKQARFSEWTLSCMSSGLGSWRMIRPTAIFHSFPRQHQV